LLLKKTIQKKGGPTKASFFCFLKQKMNRAFLLWNIHFRHHWHSEISR